MDITQKVNKKNQTVVQIEDPDNKVWVALVFSATGRNVMVYNSDGHLVGEFYGRRRNR